MPTPPPRPVSTAGIALSALAKSVAATPAGGVEVGANTANPTVTGATLRADEVRGGDLFGALPGARAHGAQFAAAAIAAGAVAVLTDAAGARLIPPDVAHRAPVLVVEDPRQALGPVSALIYGNPSARMSVFGITGTSGKTTTCFLLEAALRAQGLATGLIGTVMTRIGEQDSGGQEQVLPSAFTTPEAPDLQALLAIMLERGVQAVSMEVSSHALALGRVGGTRYAVGAFTNLSQDHLDFHPDMEDYFRAKAKLFDGRAAAAVVVVDDEYGRRLSAEHRDAWTVSTSGRLQASWRLTGLTADPTGRQHLRIAGPENLELATDLAIPGAFNAANALTAIACVHAAGYDPVVAAKAISTVQVPGRMQRVDAGQDFLAVVDYAHKPAALAAVLDAVRGSVPGRIVAVIGAGGDRDTGKRALMGAAAAARADLVIVTDDNPRSEDPQQIRLAVLAGATSTDGSAKIEEIGDRGAAIVAAVAAAGPGDAVLIAGKGHETGQEIDGVKHPFSDVEELRKALAGR
ncbi:MAG: UDP-N-acetylmuramoyl-L-alanyl-D-glutamate--2,6-diaminopimelate ligase [Actinomycetota bacterium]|nr:UDP-N-acetylmuramoyl-L-alanyl-D-glutamate--2,6-diaminopimelate ligase [Actinomycetota bacterium]